MSGSKYVLTRPLSVSALAFSIEKAHIADAISLTLLRWPRAGGVFPFQGSPVDALAGRNSEESLC